MAEAAILTRREATVGSTGCQQTIVLRLLRWLTRQRVVHIEVHEEASWRRETGGRGSMAMRAVASRASVSHTHIISKRRNSKPVRVASRSSKTAGSRNDIVTEDRRLICFLAIGLLGRRHALLRRRAGSIRLSRTTQRLARCAVIQSVAAAWHSEATVERHLGRRRFLTKLGSETAETAHLEPLAQLRHGLRLVQ